MDFSYLNRAANKCGFSRDVYLDSKVPTTRTNVFVFPFFGDLPSLVLLSSFMLKRYKEKNKHSYLIFCSWKGYEGLFPYVDEYWSFKDGSISRLLSTTAENFGNSSNIGVSTVRNLNEFFDNVLTYEKDFEKYYDNGFTNEFWKTFENIEMFLPNLLSASLNANFFKKIEKLEKKVVLYPERRIRSWQRGKSCKVLINNTFWNALVERLIEEGISPIIYQNEFTFDLSKEFADRCNYIVNNNILHVLSMIYEVGCAIDIFTGFSRIAMISRCPFISLTERQLFLKSKDNEIDDLSCVGLPRDYIFGFSGQALTGNKSDWNKNLFDIVVKKTNSILSDIDRNNLPSSLEMNKEIPYELVRERNSRRMGVRFINLGKKANK